MTRKKIVIAGAGGMAREMAATIRAINAIRPEYHFLGYIVTDLLRLKDTDSRDHVLGDLDWLYVNRKGIDAIAIGIGTPKARLIVADKILEVVSDLLWPSIVHPSAVFEKESASIEDGVFIGAGFVGTVNLKLEVLSLCNFGCTVGHESNVGRGSVINPGANISGGVTIGAGVQIGTGAQVLQYIRIGDFANVGAGAVVTRDVPPNITVVGIPAKPLLRPTLPR